jgi:hypothetical protein
MKVYVYLYENDQPLSVEDLSGPEGDAIEESLDKYGTLDVYTNEDYAVIEDFNEKKFNKVENNKPKKEFNKPFVIKPRRLGLNKWGTVKVEFRTAKLDPKIEVQEAGRRNTRKSKMITMRRKDYLREHHHLFKVLSHPTKKKLLDELMAQQKELKERGLKGGKTRRRHK